MEHSKELQLLIVSLIDCRDSGKSSTGEFTRMRGKTSLFSEIGVLTAYLDDECTDVGLAQRLYHLRENINFVQYCKCCREGGILNSRKFHRLSTGYFATCGSKECKRKTKINSFRSTIEEKYDGNYFGEGSVAREKYKSTMIGKYGVDHNWKSGELRDAAETTMIEKYGVKNALSNPEILEKRNLTCISKHGTLDFINSEKSKATTFIKYGKNNAMQNDAIARKVAMSSSATKQRILSDKLEFFNITLLNYNSIRSKFLCNKCSTVFDNHPVTINHKIRIGSDPCIKCNPPSLTSSIAENEFSDFISTIYSGEIKKNDRELFRGNPKFSEVDVYLPELNIAFEYNGLYWHSEIYKNPTYHIEKTQNLLSNGIKLYHIWEDDWLYKKDIVKSMVSAILGTCTRIYARKCRVDYVTSAEYVKFTKENHLKGYSTASKVIGLYYNNELISLMSFSKTRKLIDSSTSLYEYELIRSCTKMNYSVVGGASKLFNFFNNNIGRSLVTYCDVSFSPDLTSTAYSKCGMEYLKLTSPGYYWVIDGKRSNRLNWTKQKLIDAGYPPEKTADEIMTGIGAYKIWDCGNHKFSKK
jgi:hypothetical protein